MKKVILFLFVFFVGFRLSYSQSGNSYDDAIPVGPGIHTADNSNGSQWFLYVPASDKKVKISTCGLTNEDTYFIVYDTTLYWVSYGNNECGSQSEKTFFAKAGKKYYICWADYYTSGTYQWILEEFDPIPGEYCENAITAIADTNIADHTNGNHQWYMYTATKTGKIVLSTCNLTDVYTYANIYKGCNYYGYVYTNFKYCGSGQITISFPSVEGETYYIMWQYTGSKVSYKWILKEEDVQEGEFCEIAKTAQQGINIANNDNGPQWFKYTATKDCKIEITNCNSNVQNAEAVIYSDCNHGYVSTKTIVCNNNQYKYIFVAQQGVTYYIRWNSSYPTGNYQWTLNEIDYQPGESCNNALSANIGNNTANFENYFIQWFKYIPTKNCKVKISNCGSDNTSLTYSIYGGCNNEYVNYTSETCGDNNRTIFFKGEQGKEYYIKWEVWSLSDTMNWKIEELNYEPGEICEIAITAQLDTNTAYINNYEQWFKYTATKTGKIVVSNCGSSASNTSIEVLTDCDYNYANYNIIWCDNGQLKATIYAEEGQTYYIHWNSYSYAKDTFKWTLNEIDYFPGEFCNIAISAINGLNNADLTNNYEQWFKYTATKNGLLQINNCGSEYQNVGVDIYNNCNYNWVSHNTEDCDGGIVTTFSCIAGETYYIRWTTWSPDVTFEWTLAELDPFPGQFCTNAITAVKGENTVDHSTLPIIWYSYTPETSGKVTIETECNNVTEDVIMLVLDTCILDIENENLEDYIIAYKEGFCDGIPKLSFESIAGKTYYIISNNWSHGSYSFTLSEEQPLPGEFCSNPITAVKGTNHVNFNNNPMQWFEYTALSTGKITLSVECEDVSANSAVGVLLECVPLQQIDEKAIFLRESLCETGLPNSFYCQQGITYKIIWYNPEGGEHDWTLDEQPVQPGEFCENALPANVGTNHSNHQLNPIIWFEYTPAVTDSIIITAECNDITSHTYMAVLDKCVPLEQITDEALALLEGFCKGINYVKIRCEAGKTYKIVWYNPNGEEYDWNLSFITNIKTTFASKIKISPNPNDGKFNLTVTDDLINSKLSIIKLSGETLFESLIKTENELIDVSNIKPGIYIIVINNGSEIIRQKFVVQ